MTGPARRRTWDMFATADLEKVHESVGLDRWSACPRPRLGRGVGGERVGTAT